MSRNVETLDKLLRHMSETDAFAMLPDNFPPEYSRLLAEQLAARGVLAVDSLTDEQWQAVYRLHGEMTTGYDSTQDAPWPVAWGRALGAALRRCATGDAAE